jgi:hypothetical protein
VAGRNGTATEQPAREHSTSDIPDFTQIANFLCAYAKIHGDAQAVAGIVVVLKDVWNARGAADRLAIEAKLSRQMGDAGSRSYLKNLDRVLRALDR